MNRRRVRPLRPQMLLRRQPNGGRELVIGDRMMARGACARVCIGVCACVLHACARVCVRACLFWCVGACVRLRASVSTYMHVFT